MRIILFYILLISSLFTFQNCSNNDIEIEDEADFEDYLEEEMDLQDIPAMSLLIFKEDDILYESYKGKSNLEENISLSSNHLFLLASISKVVTATALLQLYDEGLFSLDEKINDYLPFEVKVPNQNTPITFRMLLTHTSGIADGSALDNQYYYNEDSPIALEYFMENYLTPGGEFFNAEDNYHDFKPGTIHEYSNTGSALIGVLVEQISNKNFNDYCKENIFQPLEMNHTFWRLDESVQSGLTLVQPYNYINNNFQPIEHYTFTDYPNGGLRTNSSDLFKLVNAFISDGNSNGYELLAPKTISDMLRPQIPSIDNEVGLHMFVMNSDNNLWGHDGGEDGVATIMAFNQTTKTGVIILTNQGDANLDDLLDEAYEFGLNLQ